MIHASNCGTKARNYRNYTVGGWSFRLSGIVVLFHCMCVCSPQQSIFTLRCRFGLPVAAFQLPPKPSTPRVPPCVTDTPARPVAINLGLVPKFIACIVNVTPDHLTVLIPKKGLFWLLFCPNKKVTTPRVSHLSCRIQVCRFRPHIPVPVGEAASCPPHEPHRIISSPGLNSK